MLELLSLFPLSDGMIFGVEFCVSRLDSPSKTFVLGEDLAEFLMILTNSAFFYGDFKSFISLEASSDFLLSALDSFEHLKGNVTTRFCLSRKALTRGVE